MIHPISAFIIKLYLQLTCSGCPDQRFFRYHIFFIVQEVELLIEIVFANETGLSIVTNHGEQDALESFED